MPKAQTWPEWLPARPAAPDRVSAGPAGRVSVLRALADVAGFVPEWERWLAADGVTSSLFQHPQYVHGVLSDRQGDLAPCVVVARDEEGITCVAPCSVRATRFPLMLSVRQLASIPVRTLTLFGDGFVVSPRADACGAIDAVLDVLRAAAPPFDIIAVPHLEVPSPLWACFEGGTARRRGFRLVRTTPGFEKVHRIRLSGTYDEYMATFSGRSRRSLVNRTRQLKAALGGDAVGLERITAPEQVPAFLDRLEWLAPRTWQRRTFGGAPRNAPGEVQAFQRLARHGWLRAYVLAAGDRPVAFGIGYQHDGVFTYEETGYDQEFVRLSPGIVLFHLMMADLFEHERPRVADLGFGDNHYKRLFGNETQDACCAYLVDTWRGQLLVGLQRQLDRLDSSARAALVRVGLDASVRRLLKRKGGTAEVPEADGRPEETA